MYRNILIATDGSDLAGKAVDHGVMLAKEMGASVVFVTVTEIWSELAMGAEWTQGAPNPIEQFEAIAACARPTPCRRHHRNCQRKGMRPHCHGFARSSWSQPTCAR
jgi:hypothetical protein